MLSIETHRLFLALWPTPAARAQLVAQARAWHWPAAARLTHADRLHITLHFIGDVPAFRTDELGTALAVPFGPCDLLLDEAEVWKGGIAVLAASHIPPQLRQLHAALAAKLLALSLPVEERPLRIHATLARKAQGARPPRAVAAVEWPAHDGYALVRSLPGGRGYSLVHAFH